MHKTFSEIQIEVPNLHFLLIILKNFKIMSLDLPIAVLQNYTRLIIIISRSSLFEIERSILSVFSSSSPHHLRHHKMSC